MTVKVTTREPAGFGLSDVADNIREYRGLDATVGYGSARHPDSGLSVSALAAVHEYGRVDGSIPERSWLRSALRLHAREIADEFVQGLGRVVVGDMSAVDSMERVARKVARFVLARFDDASSWAVPLKQATVDRKGHAFPLVDSFFLREHLEWQVRSNGRFVRRGSAL